MFGAPLIRDGKVEGVFGLMHPKPSAFMPRQMEMVRAFADQAVIAIENVRLFDEVQARTRDLSEALEQQTATAEVLKIISRSAFDLNLATSTILEAAARTLPRSPRDASPSGWRGLPSRYPVRPAGSVRARGPREPNPGSLPPAFPPSRTRGRSRAFSGRLERSRLPLQGHSQIGRLSRNRGDPLDAGRRAGGNLQPRPSRSHPLHAEPDQARPDLRRSGGDRDRERAHVWRSAVAHPRGRGGARAADRDRRGSEGHQPLGVRPASGVRYASCLRGRIDRRRRRRDLHAAGKPIRHQIRSQPKPGIQELAGTHDADRSLDAAGTGAPVGEDRAHRRQPDGPGTQACAGPSPADALQSRRAALPGWAGRRGNIAGPSGAGRVHPAPHRPRPDLRRPGGDRDRERASVRRGAGAYPRYRGGARAADRDRRRFEGHQPIGVRPSTGSGHVGRKRSASLRHGYGVHPAPRWRGVSSRGGSRPLA